MPVQSVLLIEDNPMDVDLTRRVFARRRLPNPLAVVRDGAEALDFIDSCRPGDQLPAIILLDLKLPKVDGLEVLRRLKAHPRLREVPVIVLTTSAEDRDVHAAYRLGVNSYIVKPVDFEKFVAVAAQIESYWLLLNTGPRPS
jgi:CheY-like chemotaxis protein